MIMANFIRKVGAIAGVLAIFIGAASAAEPVVQATLSSRNLVRGETATLEIALFKGNLEAMPVLPIIPDVTVTEGQQGRKFLQGQRMAYVFQYEISSFKEGRHVIPSIGLQVDGERVNTAPLEFAVFNSDNLQWSTATIGGQAFRFASGFFSLNANPYEGEATPVEMKLYIPRLPIVDWGVPEFERDGVACWRFEPSDTPGSAIILARSYLVVSYPSTMAPTRTGTVSVGPANLRLMIREFGQFGHTEIKPTFLPIPKLEIEAKKLPEGAPPGFVNAVGNFTLSAATNQKEVRIGDPVSVEVTVSGTGNLDALQTPVPKDADAWKVYESSADERGEERRLESGSITFRQFMRPLADTAAIPAFELVYFDPKLNEYQTVQTSPIPLKVLPSLQGAGGGLAPATPPVAPGMPVEKMSDILGLVQPTRLVTSESPVPSAWLLHAFAGLLTLGLAVKAFTLRVAPRFRKDPELKARRRAYSELERTSAADHPAFLRQVGRFIEQWLGREVNQNPEIHAILEERDSVCFRQEGPQAQKSDQARRKQILKVLRNAAWLWIAVAWLTTGTSAKAMEGSDIHRQALEAYEASDYEGAARIWLGAGPYEQLSADTLYDIGNACYRLGAPGYAALYYHRALHRDPSHPESLQNLRFLERKFGSLTITRGDYHYALAKLSPQSWRNLAWGGGWMVVIGILTCFATVRGARSRIPAIAMIVLGPVVSVAGAFALLYYPDDSRFAPAETQAVVVGEDVVVHADASRTSSEVTSAPPGSFCQVLKERGDWRYVAFATRTRGWVPTADIEPLIPKTPPKPPKLKKPEADSRSA